MRSSLSNGSTRDRFNAKIRAYCKQLGASKMTVARFRNSQVGSLLLLLILFAGGQVASGKESKLRQVADLPASGEFSSALEPIKSGGGDVEDSLLPVSNFRRQTANSNWADNDWQPLAMASDVINGPKSERWLGSDANRNTINNQERSPAPANRLAVPEVELQLMAPLGDPRSSLQLHLERRRRLRRQTDSDRKQSEQQLQVPAIGIGAIVNSETNAPNGVQIGLGGTGISGDGNSETTTTNSEQTQVRNDKHPDQSHSDLKCRIEKNLYLAFEQYRHYTCANCYNNMPKILFFRKFLYRKESRIWLIDELANRPMLPNETELIRPTFKAESTFNKWRECCRQAVDCCLRNSVYLSYRTTNSSAQPELIDDEPSARCPATWDGLSCWPDSPAGELAKHDCPDHVYFLEFVPICKGQVSKQCFANGSWFIRNDHEWSDYSNCAVLPLYATRLLIGSVWHLVSAIVIGPALVVLQRLPNRGGSKRVPILSKLLFWLLFNGLLAATQKIGIIGGVFRAETNPDEPPPPPSASVASSAIGSLAPVNLSAPLRLSERQIGQVRPTRSRLTGDNSMDGLDLWARQMIAAQVKFGGGGRLLPTENGQGEKERGMLARPRLQGLSITVTPSGNGEPDSGSEQASDRPWLKSKSSASETRRRRNLELTSQFAVAEPIQFEGLSQVRMRRRMRRFAVADAASANSPSPMRLRRRQSPPIVFLCWTLSVCIRITRLLGYAWMFTGAVYLCSVLLFAPAEPPTLFIKWLMFLTNAFPVVIGLVYIITRTIYEPSPLTLIVRLPYLYLKGDSGYIDYLWATQLDCWMLQSKYDNIEEIADRPNLVLIFLNGVLFVVTIIIMCRINRPGSTRQEMSLGDYFKAAGTLVLLYGAHYALIVYRPPVEGCIKGQVMYYLFLFVDGIQGIAVSYVFCYRTAEGKEIIAKWWINRQRNRPTWCHVKFCTGSTDTAAISAPSISHHNQAPERATFDNTSHLTGQSMQSTISACNGKDMALELINLNDTPKASRF